MRLLLDQDIYAVTERFLTELGHDVVTATDIGGSPSPNIDLLRAANNHVTRSLVFSVQRGLIRMIEQDIYWYSIIPINIHQRDSITGKWLYFGETSKIHALLHDLDTLVEAGLIRSAKIARKLPDYDPFPEKPCVLCVFTSSNPNEKEQVRILLRNRLGILVKVWKSDLQTMLDWQEDGILRIQADLTCIRRDLESRRVTDVQAAQKQMLELMKRLENAIRDIDEPERMAEIYLSSVHALQKGLEAGLTEQIPSQSDVLSRLKTVEEITTTILSKLQDRASETPTLQQSERAKLRQNLNTYFSDTELREICFDLGIDYQELSREDKRVFVVELIMYMERRGRLDELTKMCHQMRPSLHW